MQIGALSIAFAALSVAIGLTACGNPLEVGLLPMVVEGDRTVSPNNPGEFEVAIQNNGNERIIWGMGSSSCQLSLFVIADDIRHLVDDRACTEDLVEQGLDPGDRRTETFQWDGHIPDIEGQPFLLPDGEYELVGTAGTEAESEPFSVRVER